MVVVARILSNLLYVIKPRRCKVCIFVYLYFWCLKVCVCVWRFAAQIPLFSGVCLCSHAWAMEGWIRIIIGFQPPFQPPFHRLGHITDCNLDSVVYASLCVWVNVDLSSFGSNSLRPTAFGCQATDSIPSQVSRKESLRPFILTPIRPVGCLLY